MNLLNGGVTEIRFSAMTTTFAHVVLVHVKATPRE